ncbi:RHS repeat-associated core domain-containing protein [Chryseobacterium sp. RU37D]|uniref:RHS repeat-associated core domain-containing protein n=1 Tax=Chryseobacterium sp. RU37D TaxID=1907397 RepID=UPI0015C32F04|nr:RHS repeat-associated core domain-containing protein [Chryseobacterium sp. RU37D]
MKLFSSFILSLYSVLGFSQTILYQAESTSRTVQDPQTVILTEGFHAKSDVSNPFIAKIGPTTENPGGGPADSGAGATNPSGTTAPAGQSFHDTKGNIEVNGTGQLQFTLPVALPPGVKSVAPQVNLVYTSGTGNGIAGYGWNISGITSISRIGKNIEKDGTVKGIQLDYSDLYSFNGQRLILKSGEYGKDGAEYVTEKYSNVKIKSFGAVTGQTSQGPEYWEITFEDGSQAWYGATSSGSSTARTPLEYNIVKWKDPQGNYITYTYSQAVSANVAVISSIEWGGNETMGKPHFNSISFNYLNRTLKETSYVNGISFRQGLILNYISVSANGGLFKKYQVNYKADENGSMYQLVKSITESNGNEQTANDITFNYENPVADDWKDSKIKDNQLYKSGINGDFDGDGKLDLLKLENVEDLFLYKDIFGNTLPAKIPLGNIGTFFENATSFTIKNTNDVVLPRQGFILPISISNGTTGEFFTNDLKFPVYSVNPSNVLVKEFEKTLLASKYDKTAEINNNSPALLKCMEIPRGTCNGTVYIKTTKTIPTNLREIDVDGDNISEILLEVNDHITETTVIFTPGLYPNRNDVIVDKKRYILLHPYDSDINTRATEIAQTNGYFFKENIQGDFNGDGVTDFISSAVNPFLKTFIKNPNNTYSLQDVPFFKSNGLIEGLIGNAVPGDFNGDGKTDLLVPKADKSSDWYLYTSNGKYFEKELKSNLTYFQIGNRIIEQNSHHSTWESTCNWSVQEYYTYVADDLDADGKSEFLTNQVILRDHQWSSHFLQEYTHIYADIFTTTKNSATNIEFSKAYSKSYKFPNVVVPFSTTTMYRGGKKAVILGKPDNCGYADCESYIFIEVNGVKDISKYSKINSITQGGITTNIDYKELNGNNNPGLYAGNNNLAYPFIELDKVPQTYVVSQLSQAGRKQDFRYRGFTAHLQGKGMIGFRQAARSSWYADGSENTKVWSGTEIDPLNEGIPVKEWSIRTNNENQIFPADISENNTQLLSFKSTLYDSYKLLNGQVITGPIADSDKPKVVTATVIKSTKAKDFLTGVLTTGSITYGDYYLPQQSTTNINNGYAVTTSNFEYIHNPSGIGSDYYIGRPKTKTDQVSAYGDNKSSKEEYVYENNLLKTLKTWNRDNTGYLLETYNYDGFGNITQKVISNSIDSQTQTTTAEYEAKGRFVVNKTNNLGLETNITYNNWGQILTQTDPLGNVLTNTYDAWGKLLTSKTNIGGTTTYQYERDNNSNIIVTQNDPDGDISKKYTNKLGQEYKSSTKAFGQGQFISQETQYDVLGRKIKESEPYFEGQSVSQWNTIVYDDSVFPAKATATAFTGKQMETSVSGLTTTVKELNGYGRTTSKTTDALGNVISSTDKGGTIQFTYNAAGEQIKAQYAENIVTTKYDSWGRKSEFNDPSNGLYKYEYDGFGQPKKTISPKGTKEYTYNNLGQLISQKELSTTDGGQATNKVITYTYDNKGRVIAKSGTSKGKPYSSNVSYDPQGRLLSSSESSNGKYFIEKGITYDDKGRVTSYEKQLYSSGLLTKIQIENIYSPWSGELYQVKDKTSGKVLWELKETNAKGQVLQAKLGAANVNNVYDANGFLTSVNHSSAVKPSILQLSYSFNAIKNELNSRTTGGDFNIVESFDYDDNNRLVNWTNPVTGIKPSTNRNVYDVKGRIMENDQVGTMKYENSSKIYQPTGMTLNAAGTQNYNNDLIQSIAYNENNDPVFIDGMKGDVAFQYGLTSMRQRVTYGGNFSIDGDGKFTKFYSEDGSYEILKDNTTGQEKHIIYIEGTPYESNIVYLKNFTESSGSYKFLHKDYIGSILAISDEAGNKLEQRHYDAWGNFTHLQIGNGAIITDKNIIDNASLLVERGYTGHEHFAEVGIIHMNGRLYDPLLRRFLNADENIQDPYNTQNYNKYGYVLNNPLMFNDPSGEIFGLVPIVSAIVIGAIIGTASYLISAFITDQHITLGGFFKSGIFGAISGAVTFGIGSLFQPALQAAQASTGFLSALNEVGISLLQAGVHGFAQATLSLMQGGTFEQAFVSGALGSVGASAFNAAAGNFANSAIGTIVSGAVLGGVGSELSGGNFWQGALIGGIVAGLNHTMHPISSNRLLNNDGDGGKKKTVNTNNKKNYNTVKKGTKVIGDIVSTSDDALGIAFELGGHKIPFKNSLKPFGSFLGKANIGFNIGFSAMDTIDYFNGEIGGSRLGFNLTSYATPIVVGTEFGAVSGFLAGMAFSAADMWICK